MFLGPSPKYVLFPLARTGYSIELFFKKFILIKVLSRIARWLIGEKAIRRLRFYL